MELEDYYLGIIKILKLLKNDFQRHLYIPFFPMLPAHQKYNF